MSATQMQSIQSGIHNLIVWNPSQIDRVMPKDGIWILCQPNSNKYEKGAVIEISPILNTVKVFIDSSAPKILGIADTKVKLEQEEWKSPTVFTGPFSSTADAWKYFWSFGNQANVEKSKAQTAQKFAMAQKKVSMSGLGFGLLGEAEDAAALALADAITEAARVEAAKSPSDTSITQGTDLTNITKPTVIVDSSGTPGNVILPEVTAPVPANSTEPTKVDLIASGTNTLIATVAAMPNGIVKTASLSSPPAVVTSNIGMKVDYVANEIKDQAVSPDNRKFWYGVAAFAGLWLLLKKS